MILDQSDRQEGRTQEIKKDFTMPLLYRMNVFDLHQ
jgi:hypothetical protein